MLITQAWKQCLGVGCDCELLILLDKYWVWVSLNPGWTVLT